VDRIGTGDAFMAGFIFQKLQNKNSQEVIEFATASALLKHTMPGDILTATTQEIEDIVNNDNIGKLLR
jgi:2-dehydro-3-deoxygluconokinase